METSLIPAGFRGDLLGERLGDLLRLLFTVFRGDLLGDFLAGIYISIEKWCIFSLQIRYISVLTKIKKKFKNISHFSPGNL